MVRMHSCNDYRLLKIIIIALHAIMIVIMHEHISANAGEKPLEMSFCGLVRFVV